MKLTFVTALLMATVLADMARGVEFYAATADRKYDPADTNSVYYNLPGTRPRILFDDVTVPFANDTSVFRVSKVTVKISRDGFAPIVTITPYYAQIVADNLLNGGTNDSPDFPDIWTPATFSTPAVLPTKSTSGFAETTLSFGDGITTMFAVPGSTAGGVSGFHSFALGLELSSSDNRNGWTVSQHPDNLDLLWDYVSPSDFREFTYDEDSSHNFIIGTQYLRVEGQVVTGLVGADITGDGKVDARDLLILATHWQQSTNFANGDLNYDGIVNARDLGILSQAWQEGVAGAAGALPAIGLNQAAVPEPAIASMVILSWTLMARLRQRITRS